MTPRMKGSARQSRPACKHERPQARMSTSDVSQKQRARRSKADLPVTKRGHAVRASEGDNAQNEMLGAAKPAGPYTHERPPTRVSASDVLQKGTGRRGKANLPATKRSRAVCVTEGDDAQSKSLAWRQNWPACLQPREVMPYAWAKATTTHRLTGSARRQSRPACLQPREVMREPR